MRNHTFQFLWSKSIRRYTHLDIWSYVIVGVGKQWSIRLLSSCLILELEVHRASKWERKMGVQWKEQGRCAAAITGAKSLEDGVIPVPVHTASALGGMVWVSAFGHEAKHISVPGVRAAEGGYRGRLSNVCPATHHTQRWNWVSDNVSKLQNGCCFMSTLQMSWKNLSCPLLWEIERKVDTLQNCHTPIFFPSIS